MGKRIPEKQSVHDTVVKKIAEAWKNDGWNVKADLKGWDLPSQIENYIPDIEADKTITRICEVETEETLETDKEQQETFENYCKQKGYFYYLYLAKDDGSYRMLK